MTIRSALLATISLLVAQVHAQPFLGGRPGAASRYGSSVVGASAGNAFSARASGDVGFGYNPSLIAFQNTSTVTVGTSFLSLDRSLNVLSYATPLPPTAGLALFVVNAGVSAIDGRNSIGEHTTSYSVSENAFGLTFGVRPIPQLSFGVAAKLLYHLLIEGLSSTTVGVDAGASYLVNDEFTIAAVIRDINSKYRWDTGRLYGRNGRQTTDRFPLRSILAVNFTPAWFDAVLGAEWEHVASGSLFRWGFEARVHPLLILRTGIDGMTPERSQGVRWSAGFTIENTGFTWNPSLDYAFINEPYAPSAAHMISLRFHLKE